jgi:hypothetical protein
MKPEPKSELELRYPHIVDKLVMLWGYPELTQYLDKILFADDRRREGFPPEVMEELMMLHSLHSAAVPGKGISVV